MQNIRNYIENEFPDWYDGLKKHNAEKEMNPIEKFIFDWQEYDSMTLELRSLLLWVLDQKEEEE